MIKRLIEEELNEIAGWSAAVKDWVASGGSRDFEEFFAAKEDEMEGLKNNASFRKAFEAAYDKASNGSSAAAGFERDTTPASNALNKLISDTDELAGAKSDADTVVEKYSKMERKFRRVLLGKSDKRYFILMGDPGIGKTYTVTSLCEKLGVNAPTYTGDIGSNPTAVYMFLWEHKDDKLFILDDCDSMIRRNAPDVVRNALKGAMGAPKHTLTMSTTINSVINKKWRARQEESANKLFRMNIDSLFESLHTLLGKTEKLEEGADSLYELREATDNNVDKMKVILENAFWIDLCTKEDLKENHLADIIRKNGVIVTNELCEEINDLISRNKLEESSKRASKLNKLISKLNEVVCVAGNPKDYAADELIAMLDDDYCCEDGDLGDKEIEKLYANALKWSDWPDDDEDDEIDENSKMNEASFDDDEDEDEDLGSDEDDELNTDKYAERIPTTFVFNAGMIVISNCTEKDVDPALLSRSDYATISLTPGEYMVRLASIINDIKVSADPEVAKRTKGLIMSTLPLLIEASKKGKKVGGRPVVFRHPLEFRMISTLCEDMDGRIEDELSNGLTLNAAFNKVFPKWVVYDFIPAL